MLTMLALQAILLSLPLIFAQELNPDLRSGFESVTCHNGTSLEVVYKGQKDKVIIPCTPPHPYCYQNICVPEPPNKPFFCEENGIFPHINDCNGAYFCNGDQLIDIPCPENIQFDYQNSRCHLKHWTGECKKPNCKGKHGVYVAHPASHRLYVFCLHNRPDSMHVCPLGKHFSPKGPAPCEYVCIGVGEFPDPENEELYYRCKWDGTKIVKTSEFCPRGMRFEYDVGGSRCVPGVEIRSTTSDDYTPQYNDYSPASFV